MVVHQSRTVWKNSYAEQEVSGKNIQLNFFFFCKKLKNFRSAGGSQTQRLRPVTSVGVRSALYGANITADNVATSSAPSAALRR